MCTIVKRLCLSAPCRLHTWVRCGRPLPDERGHPARPVRLVPRLLLSSVALTTAMEGETLARRQLRDRSPMRSRLSGSASSSERVALLFLALGWGGRGCPRAEPPPCESPPEAPLLPSLAGKLKLGGVSCALPEKRTAVHGCSIVPVCPAGDFCVSLFSLLFLQFFPGLPQPSSCVSHCSTLDDAIPGGHTLGRGSLRLRTGPREGPSSQS